MEKYYIYIIALCVLFILVFYLYSIMNNNTMNNKPIYAIAVFNDTIKGTVKFTEDLNNNVVVIDLNLSGLKPNSFHGFHVHEAGDLTDKCTSMCAHFNPYGKTHGCPGMSERHVGDLGNITTVLNLANYRIAKMSSADMVTLLTQMKDRTGTLPDTVTINDYEDWNAPPVTVTDAVTALKLAKSITTVNLGA